MINIFTDSDRFDLSKVIIDNDAYFYENITAEKFGTLEEKIINEIDKATIIDKKLGTIKTPRGITSIENLSTGCKTVLNYLHLADCKSDINVIDASQCGYNALEVLFSTIEELNYPVNIILAHKDNIFRCGKRQYKINGEQVIEDLLYL